MMAEHLRTEKETAYQMRVFLILTRNGTTINISPCNAGNFFYMPKVYRLYIEKIGDFDVYPSQVFLCIVRVF
jgi:hypothetical protein